MCFGGSKTPKIPSPQPLKQPERTPDAPITRRKTQLSGPRPPSGTLLTGGAGVPLSSLTLGSNQLLGGGKSAADVFYGSTTSTPLGQ